MLHDVCVHGMRMGGVCLSGCVYVSVRVGVVCLCVMWESEGKVGNC